MAEPGKGRAGVRRGVSGLGSSSVLGPFLAWSQEAGTELWGPQGALSPLAQSANRARPWENANRIWCLEQQWLEIDWDKHTGVPQGQGGKAEEGGASRLSCSLARQGWGSKVEVGMCVKGPDRESRYSP